MANNNMKHRRLQELSHSDFEIVDGQPDIRGWDVKTAEGETIGEVEELILDAQARKVRYMVVDLDGDELDLDDDRTVLIPIGMAQLHEKDDDVLLTGIGKDQLRRLPEYDDDNLSPDVERNLGSILGRTGVDTLVNEDEHHGKFYQHEHFNENNLRQRRLLPESAASLSSQGNDRSWLRGRTGYSGGEVEGYMGDSSASGDRAGGQRNERNDQNKAVENEELMAASHRRDELADDRIDGEVDDHINDGRTRNDNDQRTRNRDIGNDDRVY